MIHNKLITALDVCQYAWPVDPTGTGYYVITYFRHNLETQETTTISEIVTNWTNQSKKQTLFKGTPKEAVDWLHAEILDKLPTYTIVNAETQEAEPSMAYMGIFYSKSYAEDRLKSLNWSSVKYALKENPPIARTTELHLGII